MLVAKTKDGKQFSLASHNLEKEKLLQLRAKNQFFCPVCQDEVILKLGMKQTWHFAHKRKNNCAVEIESETAYHITGKKLLYAWFQKQNLDVQLEPYLKEVKQRPDLLVHTPKIRYAIEFQCAKLSPKIFIKRTQSYQKYNYFPLWILGGNQLKRQFGNLFRITAFHWLFSNNYIPDSNSPQILSFCPQTKTFIYLKTITAISPNLSVATPFFLPLHSFSLQELFQPYRQSPQTEAWLNAKKWWRTQPLYLSKSISFLRKLYATSGQPLWLFPLEAGIPVDFHHLIETPTYIWQSWLIELFIKRKKAGEKFHLNLVKRAFETLVKKGVFQLRLLPQIATSNPMLAIENYLKFLCCLKILSTKDGIFFEKIQNIVQITTLDQAMKGDYQVMLRFVNIKM